MLQLLPGEYVLYGNLILCCLVKTSRLNLSDEKGVHFLAFAYTINHPDALVGVVHVDSQPDIGSILESAASASFLQPAARVEEKAWSSGAAVSFAHVEGCDQRCPWVLGEQQAEVVIEVDYKVP